MKDPKYTLGQSFTLVSMGVICENVIITKRTLIQNVDNPDNYKYTYNLKHNIPRIPEPWTWDGVSEESLDEWIISSKIDIKNRNRKVE